jgi:hypothetical protein
MSGWRQGCACTLPSISRRLDEGCRDGDDLLDGLQLLRIAAQHDLRTRFRRMGEYTLQLARADHAGLVDHQDIA